MRFIHLSDIHYHPNQKTFKKYVLSPLIKELEDQNKTEKIDCVFFTGDLIDKGGFAGKDSLDPLEAFLSFEGISKFIRNISGRIAIVIVFKRLICRYSFEI